MITLKQLEESGQTSANHSHIFYRPNHHKSLFPESEVNQDERLWMCRPVSYRNRQKQLKVSELVTIGEFNIYLNENCAGCASPRHS